MREETRVDGISDSEREGKMPTCVRLVYCMQTHSQLEKARQKELQAQQMEEQRQQFKLKTQSLLQFRQEAPEPKTKASRKKVCCHKNRLAFS